MIAKPRRGVFLLLVLALLAMFAMVAVAFVVMTRYYKLSAERARTIDAVVDSPQKTLQQAFNVVVRGTPINPTTLAPTTSAITWQSLLEKIYGFETLGTLINPCIMGNSGGTGTVAPFVSSSGTAGQLIEFTLPSYAPDATSLSSTASIDPFHYVGCVVTMLSGSAAGLSSRIVGINPNNLNVQMLCFEGGLQPAKNDQYIVNGFPYSGMGYGFNPSSGSLNMTVSISGSNIPLALLPNAPPTDWVPTTGWQSQWDGIIPGGVNSDYTAVDNQDPLLALAIATTSGGISVPIPSLHRSDLIQYWGSTLQISGSLSLQSTWANWVGPSVTNPNVSSPKAALLRSIWFRPNPIDHPLFTGSNPNFNPVWDGISAGTNPRTGAQWQWDVDNDGDGIPDSVWVDFGLPVRYTSDGRAYKPLFAVLVLDMDGRLNLNAHGNLAQSNSGYYNPTNIQHYQSVTNLDVGMGTAGAPTALATTVNTQAYFAGSAGSNSSTSPIALVRGQGTGTPEVNLMPLFRIPGSFSLNNYQDVLTGGGGTMGRYGSDLVPGVSGSGSLLTFNNAFPYSGALGGTYWTHFPSTANSVYDAFGSPPDLQGMGAVALDMAGRPLYISTGTQVPNGPHDMDLTHRAAHGINQAYADNPFGPAEFESILRYYDRDAAALPQRLVYLTNTGSGSLLPARRAEFTTESNMVPVSSGVLPPSMRFGTTPARSNWQLPNMRSSHPIDLLYSALAANSFPKNPQTLAPLAAQLLPWEVIEGLKMDLNRPFGAGALTTGGTLSLGRTKTLPDQPGLGGEYLKQYINGSGGTASAAFNYAADGAGPSSVTKVNNAAVSDSLAARQLYARHLYVLMLMLADTNAMLTDLQKSNPTANPPVSYEDVTRMLAQWAINVVAYRDHNNIMIPFPYDPYPFGNLGTPQSPRPKSPGWAPDLPPTPVHTVWGCKRPELLFSETLAFHDRRTQDLSNEVFDKTKPLAAPTRTKQGKENNNNDLTGASKDPGFNSQYRPQGSLFVELYNPWTITEARTADLGPSPPTTTSSASTTTFTNGGASWTTTASWPNGGVQLNKLTPAANVNGQNLQPSPVWRLVVVDPSLSQNAPPANGDELPDPDNPNVNPYATPAVNNRPTIERVAYFVNLTGGTSSLNIPNDAQVIYGLSASNPASGTPAANASPVVVAPNGYAVIGSGDTLATPSTPNRTYIGITGSPPSGAPTRMITLNPKDLTTASVVSPAASPGPASGAPPPQVMGLDTAIVPATSLTTTNSAQRLSVSEPVGGYAAIEAKCLGYTSYDPTTGQYNGGTTSLDIPVDQQRSAGILSPSSSFMESFAGSAIWTWLNNNGTIPAFRIIYLQRLADPTRPFVSDVPLTPGYVANPQLWNPYRTVDAMTVDLTTFNSPLPNTNPPDQNNVANSGYHFEAHQRGDGNYLPNAGPSSPGSPSEVNLWKQEPAFKANIKITPPPPTPTATWGPPPSWSTTGAGWVNKNIMPGITPIASVPLNQTLGYLNQSFTAPTGTPPSTRPGDPQYPFPWLNWSYRPFNNAYELMLVPITSSSRLLARNTVDLRHYFSYVDSAVRTANPAGNPQNVYDPLPASASNQLPYPHLLNYFESGQSSGPLQTSGTRSSQFHRIFDYVGVPSRFANTQLQIQPVYADAATNSNYFNTPFNRISRYQEPGHINFNTLTSSDVFLGAMNLNIPPLVLQSSFELNPIFWDKFVRSRGGMNISASNDVTSATGNQIGLTQQSLNNMLQINPSYPSRFMRPFRTPGGAFLTAPMASGATNEPSRETDVSLLRSDPDVPLRPLFEVDDYLMAPTSSSTGATTPDRFTASGGTSWACMDFNRNPYFRYQAFQKLGSVASTHSNVFAVWITVGYFQVMPATIPNAKDPNGNLVYPDGFQLGAELGSDSGDIVRHRAFYIFDRSIPVGFLRGHDLNQDKATLLKRFIE